VSATAAGGEGRWALALEPLQLLLQPRREEETPDGPAMAGAGAETAPLKRSFPAIDFDKVDFLGTYCWVHKL